jgi:radical SAM superfamily enzyme YgiQ (UPF0313 family)
MRVTLIQPRVGTAGSKGMIPPLAMGILARFTPPGIELSFIDESVENIPESLGTDLVAMSVTTLTAKRAYNLAHRFRKRGVRVVMGGVHPTVMPGEVLQHADTAVQGAGERIWPRILQDAADKNLQSVYKGLNDDTLRGLTPERSIFKGKKYGPLAPVQFGRGCRFACDFCSVHAVYGTTIRHRPVAEVLEEVSAIRNKLLFFVDDNINAYGSGTRQLLEGLVRLKKKWIAQVSVNAAHEPDLLRLFRASGCMGLIIGFESLNKNNLGQMRKGVNVQYDYRTALDLLKRCNIMVAGSFVFGYDYDKKPDIQRAYRFARSNNFVHAYFNPLVPTPGTGLYARILRENRFTDPVWWLSPQFTYGKLPFTPKGMAAAELEKACINARVRFDSLFSIFKRGLSGKANRFPILFIARNTGENTGKNCLRSKTAENKVYWCPQTDMYGGFMRIFFKHPFPVKPVLFCCG